MQSGPLPRTALLGDVILVTDVMTCSPPGEPETEMFDDLI